MSAPFFRSLPLLEHLHKLYSARLRPLQGSGLLGFWLRFGSVTGPCGHFPSPKPCQKPKILAPHRYIISVNALIIFAAASAFGAASWQEDFAKMPLIEKVSELNGGNCAKVLLNSFRRNSSTQALILMPGATDELYFFRRVHARLTNAAPTMLDAIAALTNQTYIAATFKPPLLLLHTVEDPLEPIIEVRDEHTAERIRNHHFEKHAIFDDRDWDHVQGDLAFDLNTKVLPGLHSHDSHHFFRHSLAEFDLNGWDALEALALAGKTRVTIQRKLIVFQGDTRYGGPPPHLEDFLSDKRGPFTPPTR